MIFQSFALSLLVALFSCPQRQCGFLFDKRYFVPGLLNDLRPEDKKFNRHSLAIRCIDEEKTIAIADELYYNSRLSCVYTSISNSTLSYLHVVHAPFAPGQPAHDYNIYLRRLPISTVLLIPDQFDINNKFDYSRIIDLHDSILLPLKLESIIKEGRLISFYVNDKKCTFVYQTNGKLTFSFSDILHNTDSGCEDFFNTSIVETEMCFKNPVIWPLHDGKILVLDSRTLFSCSIGKGLEFQKKAICNDCIFFRVVSLVGSKKRFSMICYNNGVKYITDGEDFLPFLRYK
jgi:hypothetical protein